MRTGFVLGAVCITATAVSTASAALEIRSVTITNETGVPWSCVVFHLQPPTLASAPEFDAIRFADDLSLYGASTPPSGVSIIDAPENDLVRFDFEPVRIAAGEQVEFHLAVDNPFNVEFGFGWRLYDGSTELPTQGSAVLGALAAVLALPRRRGR
jgi:hypothetical protein